MLVEKFKYLENGKTFKGKLKIIFHHFRGFKGTSVAKNCLRPDSVPLTYLEWSGEGEGGKMTHLPVLPNFSNCKNYSPKLLDFYFQSIFLPYAKFEDLT